VGRPRQRRGVRSSSGYRRLRRRISPPVRYVGTGSP
jgi:hypothetical protein